MTLSHIYWTKSCSGISGQGDEKEANGWGVDRGGEKMGKGLTGKQV